MNDVRSVKVLGWLALGACVAVVGCKSSSSPGSTTSTTTETTTTSTTGSGGAGQGGGGVGGAANACDAKYDAQSKIPACAECTHKNCQAEETACCAEKGCPEEINCAGEKGCDGLSCYSDKNCKAVIDQYGGVVGKAATAALAFGSTCILTHCKAECTGAGGGGQGGAGGAPGAGGAGGAAGGH
jgi:hypothetical protein